MYTPTRRRSIARRTDAYKISHWLFLSQAVREMYDYLESRGGVHPDMVFFGLQYLLKKYFCSDEQNPIITRDEVRRDRKHFAKFFGRDGVFNVDGWNGVADLGYLPLEIWALPEGTITPVRTPHMVYWNTLPHFPWIPGYLESLAFKTWNPSTVCTVSHHCKKILYEGLVETGSPETIGYKLWDFGYRGVSSEESAEIAGAAHLVNFFGTDTNTAIDLILEYYGDGQLDEDGDPSYFPCPGAGTVATEHSVMTHLGRHGEADVVRNVLKACPTGIVAMVGDSYNLWDFATNVIGTQFHKEVIERAGVVVVRPDSGEPIPTMLRLLWLLETKFGAAKNSKGFKTPNYVRTLQGEKNEYDAIYNMIRALKGAGWSLDSIGTFGMGGALLQASTRDTQNMAIKCSSMTTEDGVQHDVYKDPITDPGKYSKAGRFAVVQMPNEVTGQLEVKTIRIEPGQAIPGMNLLRPVFRNGKLLVDESFETIRARANAWMPSQLAA